MGTGQNPLGIPVNLLPCVGVTPKSDGQAVLQIQFNSSQRILSSDQLGVGTLDVALIGVEDGYRDSHFDVGDIAFGDVVMPHTDPDIDVGYPFTTCPLDGKSRTLNPCPSLIQFRTLAQRHFVTIFPTVLSKPLIQIARQWCHFHCRNAEHR